jgi:hypothetical protein
VASGLEIVSFGYLYRSKALASVGSTPYFPSDLLNVLIFVIGLIGIAAQATALWGVSQRQQAGAPVSVRLGQWAIATYVVTSGVLFSLMAWSDWPNWSVLNRVDAEMLARIPAYIFQVALIPLTLAFGCLGWAIHGGTSPRQRWASRGLLVLALLGVFSVTWTLLGLRTGQRWLWWAALRAALRAAAWAMLGVWLRSVTAVPRSGDETSL